MGITRLSLSARRWSLCQVTDATLTGTGTRPPRSTGNGTNGHHDDEAPEPQQSLFSWAEIMAEEPAKPKGRGRKPQPATLSMFEWALTLEQEREAVPVGARR